MYRSLQGGCFLEFYNMKYNHVMMSYPCNARCKYGLSADD